MGLHGKLVSQTSIKSDGNKFYDLLRYTPNDFSGISPEKIQSVELCGGQRGTVGSAFLWKFTIEGKKMTDKTIIEAIDEEKKSITHTVVEGDPMEVYQTLKFIIKVDNNGEDNIVTWTVEYEKKSEDVPIPSAFITFAVTLTKDTEHHHLLVPN